MSWGGVYIAPSQVAFVSLKKIAAFSLLTAIHIHSSHFFRAFRLRRNSCLPLTFATSAWNIVIIDNNASTCLVGRQLLFTTRFAIFLLENREEKNEEKAKFHSESSVPLRPGGYSWKRGYIKITSFFIMRISFRALAVGCMRPSSNSGCN